jgi:nucleoside-diphosphate-sugar epimerase
MRFIAILSILGTAAAFVSRPSPLASIGQKSLPSFSSQHDATSSTALCMKTIAVFGASGLTAAECVYQALKDGDKVVGLTRNPSKLTIPKGSGGTDADKPLSDPNLTLIAGDVTKKADVDKVFETPIDGVIVALGGKTSDVGDTMLTDGTNNIMAAMKEKGVKRIAVVTSIGAGDSKDQGR